MPDARSFIRWFADTGLGDVALVGGKNASLGELHRELAGAGVRVRVPNGFAVTADGEMGLTNVKIRSGEEATGLSR